jgi:hypothetical protein
MFDPLARLKVKAISGRNEKFIQDFGRKSEGKRPFGIQRRRWENNIRMDLRDIGWEGVNWVHLVQDKDQWQAVVNMVINLKVP